MVRSLDEIVAIIDSGSELIIDARPSGRFEGTAPEPRPGIPSGHMPGTRNVPFPSVMTTDGRHASFPSPGFLLGCRAWPQMCKLPHRSEVEKRFGDIKLNGSSDS